MSSEVPKTRTPLTPQQAEALFRQVWTQSTTETLTEGALRLLLALWDLETAAGQSQFNNNFGNIIQTQDGPFYLADDTGNLRRFISYPSAEHGASGLIRQLTRDSRAHWREGLLSGDPSFFAQKLKEVPSYYEAPLDRYRKVLVERWRKYSHLDQAAPQPEGEERDGLVCPVDAAAFREQHQIALFPGQLQQWVIALRARQDTTPEQLQSLVREIFSFWQPLFPGKVSEPVLAMTDVRAGQQLPVRMRQPTRFVLVRFAYDGPATAMGAPTFVQRRRQRVEPTCPVEPLDAFPMALEPGPQAVVRDPLKPRPRVDADDPLDLGLGPVEPDAIKEFVGDALGKAALGVGVAVGGYLLFKWVTRRKRAWS